MTSSTMLVLHLSTGHVLAAAAVPELVPTAAALTGGSHLAVRVLPTGAVVRVSTELLTELSVTRDDDVLSRPTSFRVVKAVPPVSEVGPPTALPANPVGSPGAEVLSLWQVGSHLEVVRDTLDSTGSLTPTIPPGGTLRLVAVPGKPLHFLTA